MIGAKKLRFMMYEKRLKFYDEVIRNLSSAKYVCLTADMGISSHRAWIGITAHWLEEKDLDRRSVALCCKRIIGEYFFFWLLCEKLNSNVCLLSLKPYI